MDRLTTNKEASEMGMLELAYNSCYVKDGMARYRDYDLDIDARELARKLLKDHADSDITFESDEDFDEYMLDSLQYGLDDIEGLIAVFYRNLWAMADLRERLKHYEDREEKGMLREFPCKVGDTVYYPDNEHCFIVIPVKVNEIIIGVLNTIQYNCSFYNGIGEAEKDFEFEDGDFGKIVFVDKDQAEQALQELEEGKIIGDFMAPQIETAYQFGKMPEMLPMLGE